MNSPKQITHFTQLNAWKKNHELTIKIYHIAKTFPIDERFGLISQIKRSASSITANIAEGYGRKGKKDKIRFFYIANGSNMETQNHLILARDLEYIDQKTFDETKELVWEGYKLISGLISSTEKHLTF